MNKILSCLFLLLGSFYLNGAVVSEPDAKLVALNWLNSKQSRELSIDDIHEVYVKKSGDITAFYIVKFSPEGWVMVAANNKVEPILAYSTESTFNTDNIPVQVDEWLNGIGREVEAANTVEYMPSTNLNERWQKYISNNIDKPSLKSATSSALPSSIAPLLTCNWSQGRFFNELAPEDASSHAGNGHVWIGCVATAYAQLMKYWEYPNAGYGSNSYVHDDYGELFANFGESIYDWSSMPDHLNEINEEVQRISYHAAVAVNMDFDPVGSGGYLDDVQHAMIEYFRYNATIYNPDKNSWDSDLEWKAAIKRDLNEGRPVIYAGYDLRGNSGHAFVLDGYSDDFFHFNWGWGGSANGNYLLSALNPGGSNYSYNQSALMGIEPIQDSEITTPFYEDFEFENEGKIHLFGKSEISTSERHSGDYSIQFSNPTFSSYSQNSASLTFVVPQNGYLSFWVKRHTADLSTVNYQKAILMTGESNSVLFEIFNGSFEDDDWVNYKVNLSTYQGELVRLLLIQQNFDYFDNQWMYVDDISITENNQNMEPIIPSNPYPKDAVVDIDFEPILKWSGGDKNGDSVSYSIYFGESEEPPLVSTGVGNEYFPGLLNHSTTYYWKVISNDGELQNEGPVWSFTTDGIPPDIEICSSDSLTSNSVYFCGKVANTNGAIISSQGICWSTNPKPTVEDYFVESVVGSSTFCNSISDLEPFTNYYFKAYAISDEGIGYSDDFSIQTKPSLPEIDIKRVSNILRTSATISGSIKGINDSVIIERGVVWSLNEGFDPNTINLVSQFGAWNETIDFSVQLEGIQGPAVIYYKVFATNSVGTLFSDPDMFEAINTPPEINLDANNSSGKSGNNFKGFATEQLPGGFVADVDVEIIDVDADTIQQIRLILTNQVIDEDEYLFISGSNDITVEGNSSDTLILTNSALKSNNELETILAKVEYWNINDAPNSEINREVKILLNDGFDDSNVSTSFIQIIPVNDAPVNQVSPSLSVDPLFGEVVSAVQGTWVDSLDNCSGNFNFEYKWQKKKGEEIIDIDDESNIELVIGDSLCGFEIRVVETVIDRNCGGSNVARATKSSTWYQVGKIEQTLVFDPIPNQNYSLAPFVITAFASSGLPLTYETNSTDIIDVLTDSVFFKSTGIAVISCYQEGSACYFTSATQNRLLVVDRGDQEINVEPFDRVKISDQFRIFNAISSAGFPLTVSSSDSSIAFVHNDTILFKGVGSVELFFNQSGNEYIKEADPVSFTFEVLKGDQLALFELNNELKFGKNYVFDISLSSDLAVELNSLNTSIVEISNDSLLVNGVGSTSISCYQPGNNFWNELDTLFEINILKGIQIISVSDSVIKYYGDPAFEIDAQLNSGLPLSFSATDTSLVSFVEGRINIVGVGETTINIFQLGNELWEGIERGIRLVVLKGIQTIEFDSIAHLAYGIDTFRLNAIASSGLDVSFESSNTQLAEIDEDQLIVNSAGEVQVVALQEGNDFWENAESVTRYVVIDKASQTISKSISDTLYTNQAIHYYDFESTSGLVINKIISLNQSVIEVAADSIWISGKGNVQLEVSQLGNENYLSEKSIFNFFVLYPLGVPEFEKQLFSVFPNPAFDNVHLTIEGQIEYPLEFTLINTVGQVQLKQEIVKPFSLIDLSKVSEGIYFIVVRSEEFYRIEKLIVK